VRIETLENQALGLFESIAESGIVDCDAHHLASGLFVFDDTKTHAHYVNATGHQRVLANGFKVGSGDLLFHHNTLVPETGELFHRIT